MRRLDAALNRGEATFFRHSSGLRAEGGSAANQSGVEPPHSKSMTPIYFDNNATTAIHPEVAAAIEACHRAGFANPASQHFAGRRARRALEEARSGIAEILGAHTSGMDADRVIFTSGGTEANNLALRGLVGRSPSCIIISTIEHPSLVGAAMSVAESGHELVQFPVDRDGVAQLNDLENLINPRTRLVSVMLGNNETGVLQPVAEAASICHRFGILIHTDAVQCIGKIRVHFAELGVDALTVSAHKFHGPIGIGALIVKHGVPIDPILFGGFQQASERPGTESVALAVGMHRALQLWQRDGDERTNHLRQLRDTLEQTLRHAFPDLVINGEAASRLPHTSNIAFPGLDRQALVMALDMVEIACSTGSACASGSSEPSPVLLAMDLSSEIINASIRLSLSGFTTPAEVVDAAQRISRVVNDLRQRRKSTVVSATPPKSPVTPV